MTRSLLHQLQLTLPDHISLARGSLLDSDADALVNTVNTVGVMGAGIAKAFRDRYPEMYRGYRARCRRGLVQTGKIDVHIVTELHGARLVMNFPTKQDWRYPSRLEWIDQGLPELRRLAESLPSMRSIAIPSLGCGHGGLDWSTVLPRIVETFRDLESVRVEIYSPATYSS